MDTGYIFSNERRGIMSSFQKSLGFTLIELLIVVAILGMLAAISIPQYSSYRLKGFNAAAVGDLKNFKSAMESYFTENARYP